MDIKGINKMYYLYYIWEFVPVSVFHVSCIERESSSWSSRRLGFNWRARAFQSSAIYDDPVLYANATQLFVLYLWTCLWIKYKTGLKRRRHKNKNITTISSLLLGGINFNSQPHIPETSSCFGLLGFLLLCCCVHRCARCCPRCHCTDF